MKAKISAVIITFNEEKNIGRCLDSLTGIVDEIVVIDSFSTDKTQEICEQKGVKFITHKFDGHIQQKNWAITQATFQYVLSLDADEALSKELKKSILEIKKGGSNCEMITTSIENVNRPLDVDIIKTAGQAGIKYYRTGWFKYPKDQSMIEALDMYRNQVDALGNLNKENGIVGCYQNHSGKKVGASFWEIQKILETVNPDFFGAQYDIRHAVAEGGNSWENGLQLLHKKIKVIVLKDFKWGKVNGKWKLINVPIGEGMVDFDKYFKLLKKYELNPPVSLHLEYDLGGAEKGKSKITVDKKVVYDAMKKDLKAIQKLWEAA